MLGAIWSIIKSLRYVLPFLSEVTDENDKNITSEDLVRIRQLKKMLSLAIWRIIYLVIIVSVVYWGVIPLYTENAVLRQEVSERDKKIGEYRGRVQSARDEVRRLTESLIIANNDLKTATKDKDRLSEAFHECRNAEKQYISHFLKESDKPTTNTTKNKDSSKTQPKKDNTSNNQTDKQPSALPDNLRKRLSTGG